MTMSNNPRVFISYSHDSDLHKEWVRKLASDLRGSGVDAILDQWDIRLGDDLAVFMESGITSADRVIAVCSENYVLKANEGKGGVGYEKMIVTGELVKNLGTNKFIPLVRGNNTVNKVPVCLSSRAYIDFENDNEYEARLKELIRDIFGVSENEKPPLGIPPEFEKEEDNKPVAKAKVNAGWAEEHRDKAKKSASTQGINTLWEISSSIGNPNINASQKELLAGARKSEIKTFGWPIGVMLENRDEYRPRPTADGIVANINIGDRESFDYWSWNTAGDFYLLKSIFEDRKNPGEIFFNTRIVRTTEALLYIGKMYEELGANDTDEISIRINYEGIEGRVLSSSNPNRMLHESRKIAKNECSSEITIKLEDISNDLVKVVKSLVGPLFVLFDFFELSDEVYADIVNHFVNGKVV
jgi:hypothetical protein